MDLPSNHQDEIVSRIGVKVVSYFRGSCNVYLVEKNDTFYVLKMADTSLYEKWPQRHIVKESRALRILNKMGVSGIPKRYGFFANDHAYAIMKEYIPGHSLEGTSLDSQQENQLREIINEIHKANVANLELEKRNIVISLSGMPYIVDLGTARTKSRTTFYKKRDIQKLEELVNPSLIKTAVR